jgi:hypothetical protein
MDCLGQVQKRYAMLLGIFSKPGLPVFVRLGVMCPGEKDDGYVKLMYLAE